MKILWLSTETTGTDLQKDFVLRIMGIFEEDKKIKDIAFDYHIRPPIEAAKEYLSKPYAIFTPQQLASSLFLTPESVYKQIIDIFSVFVDKFDTNDKMYIGGHYAKFHADFFRKFFKDAGGSYYGSWFNNKIIDIASLSAEVEYHHNKKIYDNIKFDTIYNSIPRDFMPSDNYFPDYESDYVMPEKVKKIKKAHEGLLKYLTDLPF